MDLKGRAAVVTGAGAGIGAVTALRLSDAGADVVLGCRKNVAGAEAVAERIARNGRRAVVHQADVASAEGAESLAARCVDAFGGLDVLVNNAGAYPVQALLEMSESEWRSVLDANLT